MVDFGIVNAISTELSKINVSSILDSAFYLALSSGIQIFAHRFRFGKRIGRAPIVMSTSRFRPIVNAITLPLFQLLICLSALNQGHFIVASLIGVFAGFELILVFRKIKKYKSEVVVFEKAILECGEYLTFEKADSSCIDGNILHYEKRKRKIRVQLNRQLAEHLDLAILPEGCIHEESIEPGETVSRSSPLPLRRILSK